ncbi:MAG: hypothetical protein LBN27_11205 [Prevotellaceae bacterium]|jgi:hypothetical protein|nr:hypothetical protein [Prevotellaceae bacterium]
MKKITKLMVAGTMLFAAMGVNAATREFSLNDVFRSNGDVITYTPETGTAVINGDWQYVGWKWETPTDLSAYDWIFIEFDATGLPEYGDGTDANKLQFTIKYSDGEVNNEFRVRNNTGAIKIDKTRATSVSEVYLKVQKGGTLILKKAWATTLKNSEQPLNAINDYQRKDNGTPAAIFDKTTNTVTFNDDWSWVGLNYGDLKASKDFSAYDSLIVELAEPATQDFVVVLGTTTGELDPGAQNGVTSIRIEIPADKKTINNIYLKGKAGAIKVNRIYFKPEDPTDPRTLVDVPAGFSGDVQVILADGVGLGGDNRNFTTNAGGYADITGDFICAAGGRTYDGAADLDATYKYCIIKVKTVTSEFNPDWALGISDHAWDAAPTKKAWSAWTVDGEAVLTPNTEWQNIVFEVDFTKFNATPEYTWTRVGLEAWVVGKLVIEDIWFAKENPFAAGAIDYSALQTKVTEIGTAFVALANGSTNPTDIQNALTAKYTLASLAAFQPKYTAAQNLLTNGAASQEEVNTALSLLTAAYDGLVEKETGIYDTAADGATVTGYYSILGAKLSQEPASGVFIVKYSNGKSVKVVK